MVSPKTTIDSVAGQSAPANPVVPPAKSEADDLLPWLVSEITLQIPIANFTVRDLLNLRKGSILETAAHHTRDIPLRVDEQLIGWAEFEVIGNRLAVRITELA